SGPPVANTDYEPQSGPGVVNGADLVAASGISHPGCGEKEGRWLLCARDSIAQMRRVTPQEVITLLKAFFQFETCPKNVMRTAACTLRLLTVLIVCAMASHLSPAANDFQVETEPPTATSDQGALDARIQAILRRPEFHNARWGMKFYAPDTNQV